MCAINLNLSVFRVHVPHQTLTMRRRNNFICLTIDEDSWNVDLDFLVEIDEEGIVTLPYRLGKDLLE